MPYPSSQHRRTRLLVFRRAWRNLSLSRKLLFAVAASLVAVAGPLMLATYVSAEDSLHSQIHRQVTNELSVFERLYAIRARQSIATAPLDPIAATNSSQEMVALMGGFSAVFVGERPLAIAGLRGSNVLDLRLPPDLARLRLTRVITSASFHGTAYVVGLHPILDAHGHPVGALVRGIPQKQISDILRGHAWGIFSVTGTVTLLALVALAWMTNELVAPLRRIAHASRSLLEDGVPGSTGPTGADEVSRLADEFRALAERLADQKAALEEKDRLRGHLLEAIISAQEDERRRLSRELHDQTGQSLTTLLVGLKVLQKARTQEDMQARATDLLALVHQTLDEVHRLSVELRPTVLDDLGLVAALRAQAKEFESTHGVKVEVRIHGLEHRLPPLIETSLYRIVQEALTNVAKYAQARQVVVSLVREGDRLEAEVKDDGVGFRADSPRPSGEREHLGILGMQERATLLGGEFAIASLPGAGTTVRFTVPTTLGDASHA